MQTNQELTSQNMALQVEVGRLDDKVKTLSGEWRCDTTATECGQCKTEFSFLKSRKVRRRGGCAQRAVCWPVDEMAMLFFFAPSSSSAPPI